MSTTVGHEGKIYGGWPVILVRPHPETGFEFMVGQRMGRYGGVMVETYEDARFVEKHDGWWQDQGWVITDPPVPDRSPYPHHRKGF